jgi:hypothetical protein
VTASAQKADAATSKSTALAGPLWECQNGTLVLGNDEVHVWRAALDQIPLEVTRLLDTLAEDEQAGAGRYYFPIDRVRFIVARGVLRKILGLYLNRAAQSVPFRYGCYGKPALSCESGHNAIHFNMSHSRGVALYAITRGREIGIDLEYIREDLGSGAGSREIFLATRDDDAPGASGWPSEICVLSLLDPQGSLHHSQR